MNNLIGPFSRFFTAKRNQNLLWFCHDLQRKSEVAVPPICVRCQTCTKPIRQWMECYLEPFLISYSHFELPGIQQLGKPQLYLEYNKIQ